MKNTSTTTGRYTAGIIIAIIAALSIWAYHNAHRPAVTLTNSAQLAGIQTTSAPWIPELDHLRSRLSAIGLPALSAEGTALHIHQHLDIYIHGTKVAIPADIGINQVEGFISPIHVHDTSGVIHVESPVVQDFTLGQFFDIWGVQFNDQSIGGYSADSANTLRVYVNGVLAPSDVRSIVLKAHQEIVVTYGTEEELPKPIPSSYSFAAGL